MKNKIFTTLLLLSLAQLSLAQITLSLRPDADEGKDAYFKTLEPDLNQGSHHDFSAITWTNQGRRVTCRSVIDFDLSSIPSNTVIQSAHLSLYNNPTSPNNWGNHSNGGRHCNKNVSNAAVLRRITSKWDEFTVTWNNQPSTTTVNEVSLARSKKQNQDYTDINVTSLVQDMVNAPASSFGFMISLETEELYRCLILASSDNPDPSKHPKLVITYSAPIEALAVEELKDSPVLHINKGANYMVLESETLEEEASTKRLNPRGRVLQRLDELFDKVTFQVGGLALSFYLIQLDKDGQPKAAPKDLVK